MKRLLTILLAGLAGAAPAQTYEPPQHTRPVPLVASAGEAGLMELADQGGAIEHDRPPAWQLAEHRRLSAALATLAPQRKGVVDAYVVAAALDSDPVFGREAREAARVLGRRYDAERRTIVLAGTDGTVESALPMGSPANLDMVLARVAEVMDPGEDVLVLYTTSHGARFGIVYSDADQGFGAISPRRLWSTLSQLGIRNRLILISACYAGVFVPILSSDTTAIITAASSDRTSFGCQSDNDWTFFGDALVNRALRKRQPLAAAASEAAQTIASWERDASLEPSDPQVSIGQGATRWLAALDARSPAGASAPVGRPANASLLTAGR
ncbi:Peptidase C13 family protein [Sphingomonas sp. OV641]|uniref:C13 family peptidase n=1 Tax=Sphingomonas sp. OV641 TaxID=1881068 RepID=UPI0008ABA34E|nr:C13 family peptidase [Sphingomonas sp. OV641]SEJ15347.1 Peptidase C13 family protein [Sphingomonas sp. OV641]